MSIFFDGTNSDRAADLLAYFIKYEQQNPEMAESIRNVLKEMGHEDWLEYVDMAEDIMNSKYFDKILDGVDWIGGKIPDWALKWLSSYIKDKYGIELTPEQLRKILQMIHNTNNNLDHVVINHNGADRKVPNSAFAASGHFEVVPDILEHSSEELGSQKQTIAELAEVVSSVRAGLGISFFALKPAIRKQEEQMKKCGEACEQLGTALEEISRKYIATEKNNVEKINL